MNRIFNNVWNEITRTYVAVAENVKRQGKAAGSSCVDGALAAAQSSSVTQRGLQRPRPMMLALEARLMFDGAAVDTAIHAANDAHPWAAIPSAAVERVQAQPVAAPTAAPATEVSDASQTQASRTVTELERLAVDSGAANAAAQVHSVVVVDWTVADYQTLIAGMDPSIPVIVLQPGESGLDGLAKALAGYKNLDAIHLVTEGHGGAIQLGAHWVDDAALKSDPADVAAIGAALKPGGDLLLYGCSVAYGEAGQQFVSDLSAQLGGVDVSASTDKTGPTRLGGDWDLEYSIGNVETVLPFTLKGMQDISHCLGCSLGTGTATVPNHAQNSDISGTPILGSNGTTVVGIFGHYGAYYPSDAAETADPSGGINGSVSLADFSARFPSSCGTSNTAPTFTGTFTTAGTVNDTATTTPFASVTVNDADSGNTVKVTITYTAANGTLSGTGLTGSAGNYVLETGRVSPATLTTELRALVFTPTANQVAVGSTVQTTFTLTPNDGTANGSANATTFITATSINNAPALADTVLAMTAELEDAGAPSGPVGTLVSALVGGVSDVDSGAAKGIAITAADASNGSWWYSINNGTNWSALGAVSASSARLVASTNGRLYFQPNANWNGSVSPAITFVAWDTTSSSNGATGVNPGAGGGTTAFSTASDTATLSITAVNDIPTLSTVSTLTGATEDTAHPITYATLAGAADEADVDVGATLSFRVEAVSTGTLYTDVGLTTQVTPGTTLLSTGGTWYWKPATNANGTALNAFTVKAFDGTAASTTAIQVTVDVAAVNDAPTLSAGAALTAISEDVVSSNAEAVDVYDNYGDGLDSLLTASGYADGADGDGRMGIVITNDASNPATEGRWQYFNAADANFEYWHDIGTVSASAGLVLEASGSTESFLRFVPVANFSGTPGGLTIHAIDNGTTAQTINYTSWDGTTETRVTFDTTADDATSRVSASGQTWSVAVNPIADTPSVTNTSTTPATQTTSGLVLTRNVADSTEVTHFKITGIINGNLFKNDGTTAITNGMFITFAEGNAGLKFTPTGGGDGVFTSQASTSNADAGLGGSTVNSTISVGMAVASPTVNEDTDSGAIVLTRGAAETFFKITGITGGTLYSDAGYTTAINNGDFLACAGVSTNVYFSPTADRNATTPGNASFVAQASSSNADGGLFGSAVTSTVTLTAVADTPSVASPSVSEDTDTGAIAITRAAGDGAETTHYKVTGITGGTLYSDASYTTAITNGTFITSAGATTNVYFRPTANRNSTNGGNGAFTVQASKSNADAGLGGSTATSTITLAAVADTPSVTNASTNEDTQTTSGLVLSRNAGDSTETSHFKITGISGGTLYKNDGSTAIGNGDFITFAEGNAGLKFSPTANSSTAGAFTAQGSSSAVDAGLAGSTVNAAITVTPIADTPSVSAASTTPSTQTTSGLVLTRNVADSTEVTHFKITGITNGNLFKNDGTTAITNGTFITFAEGNAGLKFTPTGGGNGVFTAQASTSNADGGLGGSTINATIAVGAAVASPSVNEDIDTGAIAITQGGAETHYKITGITGGTLYSDAGYAAQITDGSFIANAGATTNVYFRPTANRNTTTGGNGSFVLQASGAANDGGLTGSQIISTITLTAVADTPTVGSPTVNEDSDSGAIAITRAAGDGAETTHYKVTGITGGTLYSDAGYTTAITNGTFITSAGATTNVYFRPTANRNSTNGGNGAFTVQASKSNADGGLGGSTATSTITLAAVADTPAITNATTNEDTQSSSGLVLSRNAGDGAETTHFKITGITGGTLYKTDGTTAINNNDFITYAEGNAGLKFTPTANRNTTTGGNGSFTAQASSSNVDGGLAGSTASATITLTPIADTPSVTGANTTPATQTTSGLVLSRAAVDGAETTYFKITGITNGNLFKNDGTTAIANGAFITFAEGNAGLKFTPTGGGDGVFTAQASTSNADGGLGGSTINATIAVGAAVASPTINEDIDTGAIAISGNTGFYKITGITGGALYSDSGFTTAIATGGFIATAGATTNVYFRPTSDFNGPAGFSVQGSSSTLDAGLVGNTAASSITVTAVNDAPVASGGATLAAVNEDVSTAAPGATVATLFTGNFTDAKDTVTGGSVANSLIGIAINSHTADPTKGAWQYQVNGAGAWTALGSASTAAAVTLKSTDLLRFVPLDNYNGAATALTAHLIETGAAAITSGSTIDLSAVGATGNATHYSSSSVSLGHTVTAVNDLPTLTTPTAASYTDTSALDTFTTNTGTLAGADIDTGTTLTYGITGGSVASGSSSLAGTYGTLSVNTSTGAYTYTPNATAINALTASTTDTFTVSVSDGTASTTATYTVNLTAANDTPALATPTAASYTDTAAVDTFTANTGTLTGTDRDTGATLTYGITGGTVAAGSSTLAGTYGSLSVNTSTGAYTYTPNATAINALTSGTPSDSFTVTATDSNASPLTGSATLTVNINGTNDTPTVTAAAASATLVEAGGVANATTGTASATIALSKGDLDGSASFDTTAMTSAGWATASAGVTYTKTGTYGSATLTVASGVVSYALNDSDTDTQALTAGQSVTDSFTVQVIDNAGAPSTASVAAVFAITGANDTPVLATPTTSTYTDTAALDTFNNDTGTLAGSGSGATLTYGITGGTISAGSSTLAGTYGSLSVNTSTGAYTYTPNATAINALTANTTDTFTVSVSDGALSTTATYTVNLTAANDTPVLANPTAASYTDTTALDTFSNSTGTLAGSDRDTGATLTYGITGGAVASGSSTLAGTYGSLSVNTTNGAYTYTPNNDAFNDLSTNTTESFSVFVSDGALSTSASYVVRVTATPEAPPTPPAPSVPLAPPAPPAPSVPLAPPPQVTTPVLPPSSIYVNPNSGAASPQTGVVVGGTVFSGQVPSAPSSPQPTPPTTPTPNAPQDTSGRGTDTPRANTLPSTLAANRDVPDLSIAPGQSFTFTLPRDTFISSGEASQVTYKAVLVGNDGRTEQPLPSWVRFDPVTGTFRGTPPSNSPAELRLKVIARDSQGNEASVTMTIQTTGNNQGGERVPVRPQSKFVGEDSVFALNSAEPMDGAARAERQVDSAQRSVRGETKLSGRASLSEQIRLANRHRASLDRLTSSHRVS